MSAQTLECALKAAIIPIGRYSCADPVSRARHNFAIEILGLLPVGRAETDAIQAERIRLARMIEAMATESPWSDSADSRMALAIAASNVRRGRPLSSAEKFENLCSAIAEDDPELAERIRSRATSPTP